MSARYSLSRHIVIVAVACVGAFGSESAVAADKKGAPQPAPTIKDLESKEVQVSPDPPTDVQPQQAAIGDHEHRHVPPHLVRVEGGLRVHEVRANALHADRGAQNVGDERRVVACRRDGLLEGALHARHCSTRRPVAPQAVATSTARLCRSVGPLGENTGSLDPLGAP